MRDGEETKLPVDPSSGENAATNDETTWGTFDEALQYYQNTDVIEGVGFVFVEIGPYLGIDLDYCRDPDSGEIDDWAIEILSTVDGYVEISPSGTGVHIILKGELPGTRNRSGDIEMYETGRYFTITGQLPEAHDGCDELPTDQAALDEVYTNHIGDDEADESGTAYQADHSDGVDRGELPESDQALLERAKQAENGRKFARLWGGQWQGTYPSHSEADLALCVMLAFWTQKDPMRMDRLFRRSGLMRDKWDEDRGAQTYGELTINKALARVPDDEVYDPEYYDDETDTNRQADRGSASTEDGARTAGREHSGDGSSSSGGSATPENDANPPGATPPSEPSSERDQQGSSNGGSIGGSSDAVESSKQDYTQPVSEDRPPRVHHPYTSHQGAYEGWYDQVLEFEGSVPPWVEQLKNRMKELEGEVDRNEQVVAYWRARAEALEDEVAKLRSRVSELEARVSEENIGADQPRGASGSDHASTADMVAIDGDRSVSHSGTDSNQRSRSGTGTESASSDDGSTDGWLGGFLG